MVLLDKLWDDVIAGPHPERGLGKLRKITVKPLDIKAGTLYIYIFILDRSSSFFPPSKKEKEKDGRCAWMVEKFS